MAHTYVGPQEHRSLPLVAYELVAQQLAWSDLPAARLSCKELAAIVDSRIQLLEIRSWTAVHQLQRLQHVKKLKATIQTPAEWHQMQQLGVQLPQLQAVAFKGRRTWQQLTSSNHIPVEGHMQLQRLQAANFEGIVKGLDDIAALAPNLQHLFCAKLILTEPLNARLPTVTHFGSNQVQVEADGSAEGGLVFAAAFPNLQVLYQTPEFTFNLLHNIGFQRVHTMSLRDALAPCTSLHSLRVFGDSTTMYGTLPLQLQQLQQIKRVAVYGIGPAAELKGISKLQQLQHLWLTFQLPAKKAVTQLLQELLQLPQLLSLALPAKLLCSSCCPGMQHLLHQIAIIPKISQVIFLHRAVNAQRRKQSGDFCPHEEVLPLSLLTLEVAQLLDFERRQGCSLRKQQIPRLQLVQLQQQSYSGNEAAHGAVLEEECQAAGHLTWGNRVWGMLGPSE